MEVGMSGLIMVSFFSVYGGAYGSEPLLSSAPPGLTLLAVILVGPLLYCGPLALITAELATAMPVNGGLVVWIEQVCGPVGVHNTYWVWIEYLLTASSFARLAADYGQEIFDLSATAQGFFAMGLCFVVMCIQLVGIRAIVRFSSILVFITMIPVLIFCVYGVKTFKPSSWVAVADGIPIDYPLLASWILWSYSGFVSLGTIAGQVKDAPKAYPKAVVLLMIMTVIATVWPLLVALSMDDDRLNYDSAEFARLAKELAGPWLTWVFSVGAIISCFGGYNAAVLTSEHTMSFFFDTHCLPHCPPSWNSRDYINALLFNKERTGVAPFHIIVNHVLAAILAWLPYDLLVVFLMVIFGFTVMLLSYSFLYYRMRHPEMDRPYRVPGGMGMAVVVAGLPAVCSLVNLISVVMHDTDRVFGMPYPTLIGTVAVLLFGILVHFIARVSNCCGGGLRYVSLPVTPSDAHISLPYMTKHEVQFEGDTVHS
eukprot:TRINITY_DN5372_c0_g1_i1.p1 TRINITY_DN5372_c0_g1~~TRINITY_DN5372_c0_g1_i1.p1  ORF type:complete len:490 (-),score=39.69 TRINITY_DN5372_c0_g1_i1:122-1567(-)